MTQEPNQTPKVRRGGFMRDYSRELNRVMTRGHTVIHTRQQPDSPRERIRAQIIIAIFLIGLLITIFMVVFH